MAGTSPAMTVLEMVRANTLARTPDTHYIGHAGLRGA
jgi:hypothetical protein